MVTKKTSSKPNITRLNVPSSVTTTITNKTSGEYRARAKEFYIRDQKLTGFWIRVNPNGRKVYGCYGRLFGNKETVRVTIGNTELFTAAQARKEAEEHLREIRSGISPKAVSKAERDRAVNTLETLIPEYISIRELAPRTQHDIPYRVHRHMGALVKKDVSELTVDDLRLWWQKKQAKGSKEVCLRYVSTLLTYAQARELVERNVAQDFRKGILGGLKQRDPKKRHISIYDIEDWVYSFLKQSVPHPSYKKQNGQWEMKPRINSPAIWNSNPTISETQRDYILFLLITGKRKEEAAIGAFRAAQPTGSEAKHFTNRQIKQLIEAFTGKHQRISKFFCSDSGVMFMSLDGAITAKVVKHFTDLKEPILSVFDSYICREGLKDNLIKVMNGVITDTLGGYAISIKANKEIEDLASKSIQGIMDLADLRDEYLYRPEDTQRCEEYEQRWEQHKEWLYMIERPIYINL